MSYQVFLVSYDIVIPSGDNQPSTIATIEQYIKQYVQIARSQDGCQQLVVCFYYDNDDYSEMIIIIA